MSRYRMSTKEYHWYGEFVWTFTDRQGPRGSTTSARTTPVSTPRIVILSSTVRCEKRIFVQAGCSSMCGSKGACHGGGTSACICNGWSPDETCKCTLCPPRSETSHRAYYKLIEIHNYCTLTWIILTWFLDLMHGSLVILIFDRGNIIDSSCQPSLTYFANCTNCNS